MSKLVLLSEGLTGRIVELKAEKTTIGRVEDNAFQLSEPSVSSHHCEVILRGSDVVIKDLNSTNGTYINGEKITETVLKPGQILRLGQVEMRLEVEGAAAVAAAAEAKKKPLDQTRAIPQKGVKLNEFEQGTQKAKFEKNSPFAKKTNKANVIFISVGVVLVVVIIVFVVIAIMKTGNPGQ
jgi:pSer/pThr/pTyr-binding forkhead associated (FHA) protein